MEPFEFECELDHSSPRGSPNSAPFRPQIGAVSFRELFSCYNYGLSSDQRVAAGTLKRFAGADGDRRNGSLLGGRHRDRQAEIGRRAALRGFDTGRGTAVGKLGGLYLGFGFNPKGALAAS